MADQPRDNANRPSNPPVPVRPIRIVVIKDGQFVRGTGRPTPA